MTTSVSTIPSDAIPAFNDLPTTMKAKRKYRYIGINPVFTIGSITIVAHRLRDDEIELAMSIIPELKKYFETV